MKGVMNAMHGLKPVLLMVLVQIAYTAVNVLFKLAINDGMSVKVATTYRLAFGSAFTVPLALISERQQINLAAADMEEKTKDDLEGAFHGISLWIIRNLFYESLALTSATFASALYNLIPAITFVLAISCGAAAGRAKVLGTIIGIGGAMVLTFIKGAEINIWPFHISLMHPRQHQDSHVAQLNSDSSNTLLGALCSILSCFSFSLWLTIQAKMSKEYPCHYSSTALMSTAGAIQAAAFGFCVERDFSQWKLGWNIRLLAVAYSGIVASGIVVIITAWCIQMRGPLFASVFNPLMLVLVAIAGSLMLNENLYVGSVVGAVLIVCGLYMVLWGKSKEMKNITQLVPSETIREAEAVEVVVVSTPMDHDKCDHDNRSEITAITRNLDKDCEDLTKK
ncbi:hypothetical protein V8G54_034357 [Vigna mungo]|uniref:WAT1-related protein n=1 Tax=Vigna mungo TaxID=3915 RepID=A0AAQ3MR16_VIGMU